MSIIMYVFSIAKLFLFDVVCNLTLDLFVLYDERNQNVFEERVSEREKVNEYEIEVRVECCGSEFPSPQHRALVGSRFHIE
jgi:hypothetical protein